MRLRDYAGSEDDAALRELFAAGFGQQRPPAYFRWKYRDNPAGAAQIALAEVDGRPASMACALPVRMTLRGRAELGSISVDIATLPEMRGRGLYRTTAERLWKQLAERGFAFTYGFTNRFSTKLTLELLGRREVGALPVRVRPLRPLALVLSQLRFARAPRECEPGPPHDPAIRLLDRFDARFDGLWRRIEPSVDIAAIRDARYLNWRYAEHPDRPYEILALEREGLIVGYLVWRMLDRFGTRGAFVADLAADPNQPSAATALLEEAARRARARGATLLCLLSWPGCPSDDAARRFAFLRVPQRFFPQINVFSVISHREHPTTESLADATRWWLSWGDSDVV